MGRYRPPAPKRSAYITAEGAEALRAELHQLWKIERPQVTSAVHEAAKNGDRSENGDYIYGKRRLRQIDSRCRHLMRRMDLAEIVDSSEQQHLEKIFFGAWVTLYHLEDDTEHVYRIVGKDELAPAKGYISWVSPLGKAMLGRSIGDIVRLTTPKGEEEFEVIDVSYREPTVTA